MTTLPASQNTLHNKVAKAVSTEEKEEKLALGRIYSVNPFDISKAWDMR